MIIYAFTSGLSLFMLLTNELLNILGGYQNEIFKIRLVALFGGGLNQSG